MQSKCAFQSLWFELHLFTHLHNNYPPVLFLLCFYDGVIYYQRFELFLWSSGGFTPCITQELFENNLMLKNKKNLKNIEQKVRYFYNKKELGIFTKEVCTARVD